MLRKLQNLLFEDDEIDEEEEEEVEEEVEEVKPAKKKRGRHRKEEEEETVYEEPIPQPVQQARPEPAPAPAPVQKPVMKRVEVTQAISVPKPEPVQEAPAASPAFSNNAAFQRPSAPVQHASPRPISANRPAEQAPAFNVPAPQPSSFSISADDSAAKTADRRPQTNRRTEIKRPASSVYEFRPVISPMFGVDEKDINMMSYVAKNEPEPEQDARATSQVLSPIYGVDQETTTPSVKEKQEIPSFDGSAYQPQPQPDENTFPEFSLDDILSARDEEFNRQSVFDTNQEYRTPDIDETAVIDSNQYSPYDQQTLDFNRNR